MAECPLLFLSYPLFHHLSPSFLPPPLLPLSSLSFFLAHHDNRSPGVLYRGLFSNHEDHAERTTHDQRDAREWVSVCTGMGEWRMEYQICVWGGGGGGDLSYF